MRVDTAGTADDRRRARRSACAWWLLPLLLVVAGCGPKTQPYDPNVTVPKGDPAFPRLGDYWVIDRAGVLSADTIEQGDATCQKLKEDGIAEVVVVVMKGVKQPDEWATHYGRWLKLGSKGFSTEGGNRGVVWLIRPDAPEKMTISVGRGLPQFTTVDYGAIMDHAKDYLDFGNYDRGVSVIIQETDQALRRVTSGQGDR